LSGTLSPEDDESIERNDFWKKVIGYGVHGDSVFCLEKRKFSGRLTPNNLKKHPKTVFEAV